jgi:IS30 family transposase
MKQRYQHLSTEERDQIAILKHQGHSLRAIARVLGRDPATLSRELKRNAPPIRCGYYLPHKAQARAQARRQEAVRRPRLKTSRLRAYTRRQLKRGWSPELIAGRIRCLHWPEHISPEAIYQWVYTESRDLIPCLARAHRRRLRRGYTRKYAESRIPGRVSITRRSALADARRQLGHWEADTLISRRSAAALGLAVERKTRYSRLRRLARKQAAEMRRMLTRSLRRYPKQLRRSLTYDNGLENAQHQEINQALGTKSYFCRPYTSQEKGTVEHMAGLVRRFFPKGTDFDMLSSVQIQAVERWLNHRPMKCLDFFTPAEAFRRGVALQT